MAADDLIEDWQAINHPPKDAGCVVCGVGDGDIFIGDTPTPLLWRCRGCNGLVCPRCVLCVPDGKNLEPHAEGREYFHDTLCSIRCWERVGRPDE